MTAIRPSLDRKEQIISAAIDRLFAVGFEGFRVGDVAKDVGINNATLIHHYPSKMALIKAVVERFTKKFETVADAIRTDGTPSEKLAKHMRSSVELMRTTPEMFVVLNEIMIKARRDMEISTLVAVPLTGWRRHIISLLMSSTDASDPAKQSKAEEIATACMAQLLGMGLLLNATDDTNSQDKPLLDQSASWAIAAITSVVEQAI